MDVHIVRIQNEFLINLHPRNINIIDGCFCVQCRQRRVTRYRLYNADQLFHLFTTKLPPHKEDMRLFQYHKTVLELIVAGKVYRDACLANTGYSKFKWWAKRQPQFSRWEAKPLQDFCDDVNLHCNVFDNWDIIVRNLTDGRMDQIDARRFSAQYFWEARNIGWCLSYNEQIRNRRRAKKPEEPKYPEDKYNAILQNIVASGILDDIDRDQHVAAMFTSRLQRDIVGLCRR